MADLKEELRELHDELRACDDGFDLHAADVCRRAEERIEALEKGLALFVAATGKNDDGTIWVEPDRVPFDAWVRVHGLSQEPAKRD